jgi:hypothetical protein
MNRARASAGSPLVAVGDILQAGIVSDLHARIAQAIEFKVSSSHEGRLEGIT